MAQVVALVMLVQIGATGVSSLRVGEFLSMEQCKISAAKAVTVVPLSEAKIGYVCVPLSK